MSLWGALLVAAAWSTGVEAPYPGLAWSHDGRWLAYTTASSPPSDRSGPPDAWFYHEGASIPRRGAVEGSVATYRLVATELASGRSTTIAEGPRPISPPA